MINFFKYRRNFPNEVLEEDPNISFLNLLRTYSANPLCIKIQFPNTSLYLDDKIEYVRNTSHTLFFVESNIEGSLKSFMKPT